MKTLDFSNVQTKDLSLFSNRVERSLTLVQQIGAGLASIRAELRCLISDLCIPSRDSEHLIPIVSSDTYKLSMEALEDLVDSVRRDTCRLETAVSFLPKRHLAAAEVFKDVYSALVANEDEAFEAGFVDSTEKRDE